ncbi:N-acetylneuraminate synthase, partial [Candidatus Bipolaricaulota bacterium]|nr:N-acetylneuraminate synthase [Candidatus Bipolaricaulota bacterium]
DAVKFQTFRPAAVVSERAPKAAYQRETTGADQSQLEMLRSLVLPPEAHEELQALCREQGVMFVSTPFDNGSVDLLHELDVPFIKIGSGEITNLPFLVYVANKRRPIVLSTGMSTLIEVEEAIRTIERAGSGDLLLLHCVSNYPADPGDVNLRAMGTMADAWGYPVGYSDHTRGIAIALAAVAMGACVIEKHFTLDRHLPGPDHRASLEPEELRQMVDGIRAVEAALGTGRKEPAKSEAEMRDLVRRSIVAAMDVEAGAVLTEEMLACKRPGTGLPPSMLPRVVGRRLREAVTADTLITRKMLEGDAHE